MDSTVNVVGNAILDSPYEAFQFQNSNDYSGAAVTTAPTTGYSVSNVNIVGNLVHNVGTFVFQDQAPGSAYVAGDGRPTGSATRASSAAARASPLNRGLGDLGFDSTHVRHAGGQPAVGVSGHDDLRGGRGRTGLAGAADRDRQHRERRDHARRDHRRGRIQRRPDPQHPCGDQPGRDRR